MEYSFFAGIGLTTNLVYKEIVADDDARNIAKDLFDPPKTTL